MASKESVTERIKGCLIKTLKLELSSEEIADDEALFEGGLGLNSIAILEVVAAVEAEFGIEVPDEDLTPTLIESVGTLANYVESLCSSSISSVSDMPS